MNGIGYLPSLRVGADRIGLDGAPGGVVSGADEARAREKLAALGARRAIIAMRKRTRDQNRSEPE